jgi:hypothetical protein
MAVASRAMRSAGLALTLLLLAPALALASEGHDAGEGLYGEVNDKVITDAGFILIAAFPIVIFLLSALQFALDRRKDARKAALKSSSDWPGGW